MYKNLKKYKASILNYIISFDGNLSPLKHGYNIRVTSKGYKSYGYKRKLHISSWMG